MVNTPTCNHSWRTTAAWSRIGKYRCYKLIKKSECRPSPSSIRSPTQASEMSSRQRLPGSIRWTLRPPGPRMATPKAHNTLTSTFCPPFHQQPPQQQPFPSTSSFLPSRQSQQSPGSQTSSPSTRMSDGTPSRPPQGPFESQPSSFVSSRQPQGS